MRADDAFLEQNPSCLGSYMENGTLVYIYLCNHFNSLVQSDFRLRRDFLTAPQSGSYNKVGEKDGVNFNITCVSVVILSIV